MRDIAGIPRVLKRRNRRFTGIKTTPSKQVVTAVVPGWSAGILVGPTRRTETEQRSKLACKWRCLEPAAKRSKGKLKQGNPKEGNPKADNLKLVHGPEIRQACNHKSVRRIVKGFRGKHTRH